MRVAIYARRPAAPEAARAEVDRLAELITQCVGGHESVRIIRYADPLDMGMGGPGHVLRRVLAVARARRVDALVVAHVDELGAPPRRNEVVDALAATGVALFTEQDLAELARGGAA